MAKDERQGWLKELKVGDEVFIVGIGYDETKIGVVSHITPTGRIGVDYTQYSAKGERKYNSFPTRLKKLTPEAKQEYLLEKERQEELLDVEIIGNIYENQELLENKGKLNDNN